MNVIDSLVILLGMDVSGLVKGQKQAQDSLQKTGKEAEKQQKELDQAAKRTAESYKKIRDGILEVTAAIVGAVAGKEFLAYITANDVAVGRLAKNLGVASEELSAWEGVARRLGGQGSDADSLFRGVNKLMEDFKLNGGSGEFSPLVRAGLDLSKFMDKSTSYTDRLLMMRDAMRKLSGPDAQRLGQMAGFSEEGLNILVQTDRALEQMLETQKKMNVVSEEDRRLAVERSTAWGGLTETLTGFGRKVTNELTPLLTGVLGGLKTMFLWMEDHVPVSIGLLGALGSAILLLKGYSIASFAAQFTGGIASMGGAVGALLGWLGLLGAALSGGYLVGTALEHYTGIGTSSGTALWDRINGRGPDMSGGYVPGTQRGLGNTGGAGPLGIRNNNPGNLNFAGQAGASRSGRFAAFGSMAEGIAALDDQLRLYASRGNNTVRGIIGTYAPPGENDTGSYIAEVAKQLGVGADAHLNLNDANTLRGMIGAITNREVGAGRINVDQINAGMALSMSRAGGGGTQVTTGDIHVHSNATDSKGVARDTVRELRNFSMAAQANAGLS
jgi:hypothetical protein